MQSIESALAHIMKPLIIEGIKEAFKEMPNNQPATKEKEILTIDEACDYLDLKKSTIYSKTSNGSIPCFKKGKKLYFRRSELDQWIDDGKQEYCD